MTQYYSTQTGEFYDSQVHLALPDDAVEITVQMLQALLTAIAQGTQKNELGDILATRKYVDEAIQKNRDEIEQTVQEKYSGLRHMQVFDKDGEFTVPEDCTRIKVRVWGGGGGGSIVRNKLRSESGAGGGYAEGFFTVAPGATLAVAVGAAGKAGGEIGEDGGSSAVDSFISATGGKGGGGVTLGGVGQGGNWQVAGSGGQPSVIENIANGTVYGAIGGTGGSAYGSSGGLGGFYRGQRGPTPGGGGAGGGMWDYQLYPSGDGGAGLVIIEY